MRDGDRLTIPSAGPYYISDFNTGEYMILARNPNYTGPRPSVFDAIALREGIDPGQAIGRVEDGSWDGIVNMDDPLLAPSGALADRWGAGSLTAAAGDQRYFVVRSVAVDGAHRVNGQFFSPRLGCRIFPPFAYGVDLAALCVNSSS